jgi:hypothetical protein
MQPLCSPKSLVFPALLPTSFCCLSEQVRKPPLFSLSDKFGKSLEAHPVFFRACPTQPDNSVVGYLRETFSAIFFRPDPLVMPKAAVLVSAKLVMKWHCFWCGMFEKLMRWCWA